MGFGTRYYGSSSSGAGYQEYGSATTIQVPRAGNHTVADHEFELSRVVVQGDFGSSPSLLQTGLYRSGADIQLDTCATSVNAYTYYMEYKVSGVNGYNCATFGVAPTLETDFYAVAAYPAAGSGEWEWAILVGAGLGGGAFEPIGGSTAIPMVGEELNNDVGIQCQASSSATAGFYAYPLTWSSLADDWYVYFSTNGGNAQPITNPSNTVISDPTNTNLWSIPNVPFNQTTISHTPSSTCDTNHGNG
jgi:hypothetical protein